MISSVVVPAELDERPHGLDHVAAALPPDEAVRAGGRDHHADPHARVERADDAVGALARAELGGRVDADPVEVRLHRLDAGGPGVGLGVRVAGGRARDDPPVVEDLGDVDDLAGALGDPEHEVVVLGALEALVEAADLADQRRAQHGEVAGVHVAAQRLRRPGGLAELVEERRRPRRPCPRRCRGSPPRARAAIAAAIVLERPRHQQVVVVEQGDELAAGGGDAVVGRDHDVAVARPLDHA